MNSKGAVGLCYHISRDSPQYQQMIRWKNVSLSSRIHCSTIISYLYDGPKVGIKGGSAIVIHTHKQTSVVVSQIGCNFSLCRMDFYCQVNKLAVIYRHWLFIILLTSDVLFAQSEWEMKAFFWCVSLQLINGLGIRGEKSHSRQSNNKKTILFQCAVFY